MQIIQRLQNDILEQNTELSSILRKAKVLASELNNIEIKAWIDNELNGYHIEEELPKYRKFTAINLGIFECYNSIRSNIPISVINIPDETIRNDLQNFNVYDGVKSIESIVKTRELDLKQHWPAEAIYIYNLCNISQNCTCIAAWKAIPIGRYEQLLDTIRNRLLEFTLKLQEKYPEIGESSIDTKKISEKEVTQIFYNIINGGQCFFGSTFNNCQVVQQNDLTSLLEYLMKVGVPSNEIDDLKVSIQKDKQDGNSKNIGSNVIKWISKLSDKVLSSATDKTLDISLDVVKMALLAYFGLNNIKP
jgi:hypothetical protein